MGRRCRWPNAKVLGVTATPERLDGVGLREAFDEMVVGPDVRVLIDDGHLPRFACLRPAPRSTCQVSGATAATTISSTWNRQLTKTASLGDVVQYYQKHLTGRTAIAFCVTVAHAEHVALRFRDHGISAASIDGTMSSDQRHALVSNLRDGVIRV